jgi:8-oxo-dGTP diphosphatase
MPHIHDLIDFVVAVYITYNGKVLLVDHKKIKSWMPIGGHIELDEDPEEALLREIQEECGLNVDIIGGLKADITEKGIKPLLAPMYMDIHDITDAHKHVGLIYFAKAKTDTVKLAEREHHAFHWFTKEELEDVEYNIKLGVSFYAKKALDVMAMKVKNEN